MQRKGDTLGKYFGSKLGELQDPDEPNDPARKKQSLDGVWFKGKGSQGGGSKPTPQAAVMKRGSGKLSGSYPKSAQKLRG